MLTLLLTVMVCGVGFVGSSIAVRSWQAGRRRALAEVAALFDLGGSHGDDHARGTLDGAAVEFRYTARGRTKHAAPWTEIEVDLPAAYPLELHVRRQRWSDQREIERGTMVDVTVGDRAFDREFLVEAAPAEIARTLLDDRMRRVLVAHARVELTTERVADRPVVRLAITGWLSLGQLDQVKAAVAAMARLGRGVRAAYAAGANPVAKAAMGAPYRPEPVAGRDPSPARAREVADLKVLRRSRQARMAAAEAWHHHPVIVVCFIGAVIGLLVLAAPG